MCYDPLRFILCFSDLFSITHFPFQPSLSALTPPGDALCLRRAEAEMYGGWLSCTYLFHCSRAMYSDWSSLTHFPFQPRPSALAPPGDALCLRRAEAEMYGEWLSCTYLFHCSRAMYSDWFPLTHFPFQPRPSALAPPGDAPFFEFRV